MARDTWPENRSPPAGETRLLGSGIGRHVPGPGRSALFASLFFHFAFAAAFASATLLFAPDTPEFQVYRVKLFSPPPQVPGTPEPAVAQSMIRKPQTVTELPRPEPPEPKVEAKPKPKPPEPKAPEPKPRPVENSAATKVAKAEKKEEAKPVAGAKPDPDSPGGENIDMDIEGQEFPYPDYLENIIIQLNRYFRWSGDADLKGQVAFYIQRDGTTGGSRVIEKSGDFNFDLEMLSAVEQAGKRGAFGALPDGWVADKLWVKFRFLPPG